MAVTTLKRIDVGSRAGESNHLFREVDGSTRTRSATSGRRRPASVEVPGIRREIQVKIASEFDEFKGAFRLLATNYRACGYESPSTGLYRFTPYHVLPTTVTVVAKHASHVVATLSVVLDTDLCGLPMESVYGAEIDGLRQQGRHVAEATCLADRDLGIHEFVRVFKTLIKVGMQYHLCQGGDSWVIAVNPRHRGFYEKVLGFVPLGPRRAYPSVQGHPAEAYVSGVDLLRTNAPEMSREVLGEELPSSVLRAPRWSPSRVRYFGKRSTQADGRSIDDLLSHVERYGGHPRWARARGRRRVNWGIPSDDHGNEEGRRGI
jgi:hypothetical protein